MKILGISGIARSVPFKRAQWPGLEERLYRISQGHDSAAALIVDGEIVAAAAEERFNRKKHCGDFPAGAIQYCLAEAGLAPGDVDALVHGFDYSRYEMVFRASELGAREYREVYSKQALLDLVAEHLPGFPADASTRWSITSRTRPAPITPRAGTSAWWSSSTRWARRSAPRSTTRATAGCAGWARSRRTTRSACSTRW